MKNMFNERSESDKVGVSETCTWSRMQLEKLDRELRNCYQEIEYLQDQLNLRSVEANFMAEHVQILELKLKENAKLNDKLKLIGEELVPADSQCLILMELKYKKEELRKSGLQIENLEALQLDSQCEIESLKLDITALEQRCVQSERYGQQLAEEKVKMDKQLEILETQLQEKQRVINHLESEKKVLRERIMLYDRNSKRSSSEVEHNKVLRDYSAADVRVDKQHGHSSLLKQREGHILSRDMRTSAENLGSAPAKLVVTASQVEKTEHETEKMVKQIHEYELLVKQLQEELMEVKFKAKEEAEDLTQEMAELRYQLTCMLEEESKRRALVEEASIRRVQDLEAQVQKEQNKTATALKEFQEVNRVAEKQSTEIRKLKNALEKLHPGANREPFQKNESCSSGYCSVKLCTLDLDSSIETGAVDVYANNELNRALIEWYRDESSIDEVDKDRNPTEKKNMIERNSISPDYSYRRPSV